MSRERAFCEECGTWYAWKLDEPGTYFCCHWVCVNCLERIAKKIRESLDD